MRSLAPYDRALQLVISKVHFCKSCCTDDQRYEVDQNKQEPTKHVQQLSENDLTEKGGMYNPSFIDNDKVTAF